MTWKEIPNFIIDKMKDLSFIAIVHVEFCLATIVLFQLDYREIVYSDGTFHCFVELWIIDQYLNTSYRIR